MGLDFAEDSQLLHPTTQRHPTGGVETAAMHRARILTFLGLMGMLALAGACGSSGSKTATAPTSTRGPATSSTARSASTSKEEEPTTSGGETRATTAETASGGWPGAHGCDSPSSDAIGAAFGTPITKTLATADQGCLWETATAGRGVQVSYHTPDQDPFNPAQLNFFHTTGKITDLSIPGATQAFIRDFPVPTIDNPVAYIIYPEGGVQIAFTGAPGSLVESNLEATVKVFTGG